MKKRILRRPGGHRARFPTRSHPELGRETRDRLWYCALRHGRVGRRQVFEGHTLFTPTSAAGWSSPVARQAHNLKVVSSNLAPAPKYINGLALNTAKPFSILDTISLPPEIQFGRRSL
jgi:hypothetical protein